MGIEADSQLLEPGNLVVLYELDCADLGGDVLRFHGYNQSIQILWQGLEYTHWPIEAEGWAISGEAQQATPTLRVGNVDGSIGALCLYLDDLVGAKLTRRRTLSKYLDEENFTDGNPTADSQQRYADDVFYVERKSSHDKEVIEFELRSALDLSDVYLPGRLIAPNLCSWRYRSADCSYTGGAVADKDDLPTDDMARDVCSKSVAGCKIRFGEYGVLPYGNFASASMVRT